MNSPFRHCEALRPPFSFLLVSGACLMLPACGGSEDSSSNVSKKRIDELPALSTQGAASTFSTQVGTPQKSANAPAIASARTLPSEGVRPEVHAFIAGLAASNAQRSTLYEAARAMQAVFDVSLSRRLELQNAVNGLARAKACLQAQLPTESEALWRALSERTYNTWLRRVGQTAFLIASRLLAQSPTNVTCTAIPPETGGGSVAPPPPPSPPPPPMQPSVAQQLGAEIVRLEQQGVLPTLDRGTDVRGPDHNDDGVRDDIEVYVATLSLTDAQKKATLQTARTLQSQLLIDPADKSAVQALSEKSIAATKCLADVFDGAANDWSSDLGLKIEAITANTPERAQRYIRFMAALSGTSVEYPSGNTCE